jgi:hypothetical protein
MAASTSSSETGERSVKTKEAEQQALTAKELEDVCLHCAFFQMHSNKWPEWKPSGDGKTSAAFNDLVCSTVKVVAEVFTMLDSVGQMQFMHQVMETYTKHNESEPEERPKSFAELINILMDNVDETKH